MFSSHEIMDGDSDSDFDLEGGSENAIEA